MDCSPASITCQLDRIADQLSEFDWNAFTATLIATIIGALVAAFIGLAVARMERPQPFFRAESVRPVGDWWMDRDGTVSIAVQAWNIGDGPAYNVRLRIPGGAHEPQDFTVAKLEPGDALKGWVTLPGHGKFETNIETLDMEDSRSVDWPAGLSAHVAWQQPPQRHRVRHLRLGLSDPFA